VGDQVQLVDEDDKYDARVGIVDEIADVGHDYNVLVAFDGGFFRVAYRRGR
jgi:hypothetical protein